MQTRTNVIIYHAFTPKTHQTFTINRAISAQTALSTRAEFSLNQINYFECAIGRRSLSILRFLRLSVDKHTRVRRLYIQALSICIPVLIKPQHRVRSNNELLPLSHVALNRVDVIICALSNFTMNDRAINLKVIKIEYQVPSVLFSDKSNVEKRENVKKVMNFPVKIRKKIPDIVLKVSYSRHFDWFYFRLFSESGYLFLYI